MSCGNTARMTAEATTPRTASLRWLAARTGSQRKSARRNRARRWSGAGRKHSPTDEFALESKGSSKMDIVRPFVAPDR